MKRPNLKPGARGRIGLAQTRLRVEVLSAAMDIKGRPGVGTTIHLLWVD